MENSNFDLPVTFIMKRYRERGKPLRFSFEMMKLEVADTSGENSDIADTNAKSDTPIMWAQIRSGRKNQMYVISYDVNDISKKRRKRSDKFLGKLDVLSRPNAYVGYKQTATDHSKTPICAILYDHHDRASTTDKKMEVCIPLTTMQPIIKTPTTMVPCGGSSDDNGGVVATSSSSSASNNDNNDVAADTTITSDNTNATPTTTTVEDLPSFYSLFMEVRREGQENALHADKLLILVQENDSREEMSKESSIGRYFADVARCLSSKNFSLIKRKPAREWASSSTNSNNGNNSNSNSNSNSNNSNNNDNNNTGMSVFNMSKLTLPERTEESYLKFGKLNEDTYCCKIFANQIDILTAFMILISRFDTLQKY